MIILFVTYYISYFNIKQLRFTTLNRALNIRKELRNGIFKTLFTTTMATSFQKNQLLKTIFTESLLTKLTFQSCSNHRNLLVYLYIYIFSIFLLFNHKFTLYLRISAVLRVPIALFIHLSSFSFS